MIMDKKEQIIRENFPDEQAKELLALRSADQEFFDILVRKVIRMKMILETGNVKAFERMKKQEEENFSCLLSELTLKAKQ